MRIPVGNFGNVGIQPQQAVLRRPDTQVGESLQKLAGTVGDIATDQIAAQTRLDLEEKRKKESNQALDAALRYEVKTKEASRTLVDQIQTGQIDPDSADALWADHLGEARRDTVGKLPASDFSPGAMRHAEGIQAQVTGSVSTAIQGARRQALAGDAASTLDQLGKLAVMPGESVDSVFAKADSLFPQLAQRAGINEATAAERLQTWKDNTRWQRARIDLVGSRRSIDQLDAFTARLEGKGDLATTLDPDKRVALIKEAESARWQLQQANQHDIDKREKLAERAIGSTMRQIESAVPLTADGWEALRSKVAGTSFAGEFNDLVTQERETQQVLRMPSDQQQQYIQQREAKLAQEGGTLADKANLQRIRTALDQNQKELEQAPLLAAQRLYGREVKTLEPGDLLQPGGTHRAAEVFADRLVTLQAMRKQYGMQVGMKPLLPQEQALLVKAVDMAGPAEATQLFGALRASIDDDDTYRAAMQQLAPDSPVKARAGLLAAAGRSVTLQENLVADDVRMPASRVAQTMLAGEAILNKTKAQKGEDGQARSLFAPSREAFAASFTDKIGDLYRGRPGAQEGDLQAAYAWYVGRAAELGRTAASPSDIDAKLAKQAVTATLGDILDFNGQGHVKAPLGMTATDMQNQVRQQFAELVKSQGLPESMLSMYDHYGLVNYRREGQFVLTLGGMPVVDPKKGTSVVIDLDPPPVAGTRYRHDSDLIPVAAPASGRAATSKGRP